MPTAEKLRNDVISDTDMDMPTISTRTMQRMLNDLGFLFRKRKRNSALLERDDIVAWRRKCTIREMRRQQRTIYYLDETWVNAGHTKETVWTDTKVMSRQDAFRQGLSTGLRAPSGKGGRLIVLHAGSAEGFLDGAALVFRAKKGAGDYHAEMDAARFQKWFVEQLLPNIKPRSVIVMDNASYHSAQVEKIFLNLIGVLVVVAVVSPWIIIPTVILFIFFFYLRRFYMRTARDVKRLEGVTRSPVFSHLSTSLYGLSTIRAFNAQRTFERMFDLKQDHHTSAWYMFLCTARWFGITLDSICFAYITIVTFSLALSSDGSCRVRINGEMPGKCCVPRCNGNYKTGPKVHFFSFPQADEARQAWIRAIPRENLVVSANTRVCERHFKAEDIVRQTSYIDQATGRTVTAPLSRLRLRAEAVPTVFPDCPSYLSIESSRRQDPESKRMRLEAAFLEKVLAESILTAKKRGRSR
ncbi:hypothetical protein HPB50_021571 [Hyalomma asiaticum]|uniref:Uncharacterized protein n=1 Tax=Hyalomma asiaticum TaxID=266040 RepID=A0ACB7SX07_HYAAI|nr:hypothetical protein HPB50_021571 [Hyalomma asiaticum]